MGRRSKKYHAEEILKSILNSTWYKSYLDVIEKDINTSNAQELEVREQEIFDIIDLPVTFINGGCFRVVARHLNFAIKFSITKNDSMQMEQKLSNYLDSEDLADLKKHLCPILAYSEHISVYPFCREYGYHKIKVANMTLNQYHEEVDYDETYTILKKYNDASIMIDDLDRSEQWGYYNNKLVILDYADWFSRRHRDEEKQERLGMSIEQLYSTAVSEV